MFISGDFLISSVLYHCKVNVFEFRNKSFEGKLSQTLLTFFIKQAEGLHTTAANDTLQNTHSLFSM